MVRRAAWLLPAALAGAGLPVAALTPLPPPCVYDARSGRIVPPHAAPRDAPLVYESSAGDGFIAWSAGEDDGREYRSIVLGLEHCPTGREMIVVPPRRGHRPVTELFYAMVEGHETYTTREIGDALRKLGAKIRYRTNRSESCVCRDLPGGA